MMRLKVGVVDVDIMHQSSRFPNLAVMKIASFSKSLGHHTTLVFDDEGADYRAFDILICSRVFDFSEESPKLKAYLDSMSPDRNMLHLDVHSLLTVPARPLIPLVAVGGTGYFEAECRFLHPAIEHVMPDYHIYDEYVQHELDRGIKYNELKDYKECSIGFTSRGCFRKCSFCVNRKFNKSSRHSPVSEFYDPSRPKIAMLDDNIFACKQWRAIFKELIAIGKPFKYKQGMDIRLVTPAIAKMLAECKYDGDITFAFDHYSQRDVIEEKIKMWRTYNQRQTKFYILTGFEPYRSSRVRTEDEQNKRDLREIRETFERIAILNQHDCYPYVMKHKFFKKSKYSGMFIQIAQWCNQPNFFKKCTLEEFVLRQQARRLTPGDCSALRALKIFKADSPEMFERYCQTRGSEFGSTRDGPTNAPIKTIDVSRRGEGVPPVLVKVVPNPVSLDGVLSASAAISDVLLMPRASR